MKPHRKPLLHRAFLPLILLACVASAHAVPRVSTDYSIQTDSIDSGGQRTASDAYTLDGSMGGVVGNSTAPVEWVKLKAGYSGQLAEVTALQVESRDWVSESGTFQLWASELLVDGSLNYLDSSDVVWSVQSGPILGINASGLATAGVVYQNTIATVRADYAGATGQTTIQVFDDIKDNLGIYAGDGLADDWQVANFGLENPLAAPGSDPDGDGQNNQFEFTAGLDPNDSSSRFVVTIALVSGQPTQREVVFHPIVADRHYFVMSSPDLADGSWQYLDGSNASDADAQRTVIDVNAGDPRKFYKVEIEKD